MKRFNMSAVQTIYSLLFLLLLSSEQLIAQISNTNIDKILMLNKIIAANNKTISSAAERRKAVTIGLNRWIRPLTIQVPDVISNLLPSSSNIIKVHDTTTRSTNKTQTEKTTSSTKEMMNRNNNNPFMNYDPMKLLNDFDQQPNIFTKQPYTGTTGQSMLKYMPNSSSFLDEGTIGDMNGSMIPLNIMPTQMMNMMSLQQQQQQPQHYMDYGHHHQQTLWTRPINPSSLSSSRKPNMANFQSIESNGGRNRYVDNFSQSNNDDDSKVQQSPIKIESSKNYMSSPTSSSPWNDDDIKTTGNFGTTSSIGRHMDQSDKSNEKSARPDDSVEKMNYYKKLFDSFDDDTNSFGDLFSSPTKQPQYHRNHNHNNQQSHSQDDYPQTQNHPESSHNEQADFFHESTMTKGLNQLESNDEHRTHSDSLMQQSHYSPNYFGNNENKKYLSAAASSIEPIIVPGPKGFSKEIKSNEQQKPPGLSLNSIPSMILPMMIRDTLPDHHIKTNHPRPVASRFKEFFKNLINTKL